MKFTLWKQGASVETKFLMPERHNRALDSQCFQRAADPARLGKDLREQGKFTVPVENHYFKHSLVVAECCIDFKAFGFMQHGVRMAERLFFLVETSTLCTSNFMLRD